MEARDERRLLRLPLQLSRLGLLIVEVFSQRCERGSILVTPTSLSTSGPGCSDRRGHLRWPPDMNSARRTGRLSHPASAAAFPFSPGGARRPFLFFSLFLLLPPPGALPVSGPAGRGLPGRVFLPGPGLRPGGFRGGLQRCLRGCPRAFRPSGPPVARPPAGPGGRRRFCRLFRRGSRFSRPVRNFPRPARRSPRPVRPVFRDIPCFAPRAAYRLSAPSMSFCTLRRRQGRPARPWRPAGAVSPWVPAAPAPRPAPPFSRRFFGPIYKRGKF